MTEATLKSKYIITETASEDLLFFIHQGKTKSTNTPLTIYKYKPEFLTPLLIKSLVKKAESILLLKNSHILRMYDYFYDGKYFYTIHESLAGYISLEQFLKNNSNYTMKVLWKISTQILTGMFEIEQLKQINGNLNLNHIYINKKMEVKLTGIGLPIKILKNCFKDLLVLDECMFISPEFMQNQTYTIHSDIYSFGVLLYLFFSKKWPYHFTTKINVQKKAFLKNPYDFQKAHEAVPNKLGLLINLCIEQNPNNRLPSFKKLIQLYKAENIEEETMKMALNSTENIQNEIKKDLVNEQKKSFFSFIKVFLVSGLIIGFLYFSYFLYMNYITAIPETTIPDVTEQPLEIAKILLSEENLESIVVGSRTHPSIPDGYVIETKPPGGRDVKQNRKIKIYLSKGSGQYFVPDLVGRNINQAKNILQENADRMITTENVFSLVHPAGIILAQNPTPNTYSAADENIYTVVSNGFPVTMIVNKAASGFFFFLDKTNMRNITLTLHPVDMPTTQNISVFYTNDKIKEKLFSRAHNYQERLDYNFELQLGSTISIFFDDELGFEQIVEDSIEPEEAPQTVSNNVEITTSNEEANPE
jgi:serine/threonine protein kinase